MYSEKGWTLIPNLINSRLQFEKQLSQLDLNESFSPKDFRGLVLESRCIHAGFTPSQTMAVTSSP
jgi:hypothetical protein